jgi:hypothetical protein
MEPLMDDAKREESFLQDDYDNHDPSDTSPHEHNDSDLLSPADGADGSTKPIQKRRRVTRACDGMLGDQSRYILGYLSNMQFRMPAQED